MYSYEKLETHMITSDIPQSEYGKSLPYFEEYYIYLKINIDYIGE